MSRNTEQNLRNVMVLALIDGELAEDEKSFIASLRGRLGIGEDDFRRLCAEVRENPTRISLPSGRDEAEEAIRLLAEIVAADSVVTDRERRILEKLADRAGVSRTQLDQMLRAGSSFLEEHADEIEALTQEIYVSFSGWDEPSRQAKFDALGAFGRAATVPLLRMFESYRKPIDAETPLDMKVMIAAQLGRIADRRAAYYFAQQISLGDMEDDVTNHALRCASVDAMGRCVGESFPPDEAGIQAARLWWSATGSRRLNQLAF